MSGYDTTNKGGLWKNKNKETENHPDMTGSLNVDGKEFWLSCWSKTSKAGDRYLSLSIKPKDGKAAPKRHEEAPNIVRGAVNELKNDIPW